MNFEQDTLFGKKQISTISFNEQEIIRDILYLHGNGNYIDCDPTYSVGNFYKKGLPRPKYCFDKEPQFDFVVKSEAKDIPLPKESCNVIMFDPPFVIGGKSYNDSKQGSCITAKRFTSFESFTKLRYMYTASLAKFYDVLKKDGIVIFKCQDVIAGGKQYFSHCDIYNWAKSMKYYPKDLFILLSKSRISDGRKQQHARKFHSYFWVLQKK